MHFKEHSHWLLKETPRLVLYARQWVDCHADAEDVVHEAFVRYWQAQDRAQDVLAYLYTCVRNSAQDWRRNRASIRRREKSASTKSWFQPSDDLVAMEQNTAIQAAVAELPCELREVVVLRTWGKLTFQQIGQTLEISPSTADSRYRQALLKLRSQLSEVV